MASLTISDVSHPLWSEQEKTTFLIFISNGIEHAVFLVADHVLRPSWVVHQEGAWDVVCFRPVKREVETVGSRYRTQQRVEYLHHGMVAHPPILVGYNSLSLRKVMLTSVLIEPITFSQF